MTSRTKPSMLAVTSHLPWPLDRGGHIRTFNLLTALARDFRVTLVAGCADRHCLNGSAVLQDNGVKVCGVPLPPRTPIGEARRLAGAALAREPYVLFRRHDRRQMWTAVAKELAIARPDVAYLDHLDSLLFVPLFRDLPIVTDLHNIYSRIAERDAQESRRGLARVWMRREARLLSKMEQRAASLASVLLAVSTDEQAYYASLGASRVDLVENGVDCRAYADLPTGRQHGTPLVLYVGAMSWPPNAGAASFLATSVMPDVRAALPDARLRIVGRNPPKPVRELSSRAGVDVLGAVDDVRPHLAEATVLAVPLDVGGGTRLKILEAFASGLPVVSTPIGCEGLDVVDGQHLVIAEREHFAAVLVALLGDVEMRARLAQQARALVVERYDWAIVGRAASRAAGAALAQRQSNHGAAS